MYENSWGKPTLCFGRRKDKVFGPQVFSKTNNKKPNKGHEINLVFYFTSLSHYNFN